jgi:general secretion pathway protein G
MNSMRRGFTLVEILVVLAIIALLAGLTMTHMDTLFGSSQGEVAKIFVSQSLKAPLFAYRAQMGDYPSTDEGLQALFVAPANKTSQWRGPYADGKFPILDPWGEPYQYKYPGTHNKAGYDLWSKGPDKTDGTDDDIGNW